MEDVMRTRAALCLGIALLAVSSLHATLAKHLDAVGSAEARSAVKSRIAEGSVGLHVLVGGTAILQGRALVYTDAANRRFNLRFDNKDYYGEAFTMTGDKTETAFVQPARRSPIGTFLSIYDEPLREGLLGGLLSTAWPLLDLPQSGAKLKYDGLKKVEDKPMHQVSYQPKKKRSNMIIQLFFDPETFRHVRTKYSLTLAAPMGATITESSSQQESHFDLEETFDGFQAFDGLTLPTQWTLRYGSQEGTRSTLWKFEVAVEKVRANATTPRVPD
jgi:hypothetical protein